MSGFYVNAEGGLTAAGYALTIAAGILRGGNGSGFHHIVYQDLEHALGRKRDFVQHAFYCPGS